MKSILAILIMSVSANAYAVSAGSTWNEILASKQTDVRLPQVEFLAGEVSMFISIESLCFTATQIKTQTAQPIYKQVAAGRDNSKLVVVGKELLATNRNYVAKIPGNRDNQTIDLEVSIPIAYELPVYVASSGSRPSNRILFKKNLALPECSQ